MSPFEIYTVLMAIERRDRHFPWGQKSFEEDIGWIDFLETPDEHDKSGYVTDDSYWWDKEQHLRASAASLDHPHIDYFDHFLPTNRPKHDIGRYVMSKGIPVPLVNSLQEWQHAILTGNAMLRSEHAQDYTGYSGLFRSVVLEKYGAGNDTWSQFTNEGIFSEFHPHTYTTGSGSPDFVNELKRMFAKGLWEGSVDPAAYLRLVQGNGPTDYRSSRFGIPSLNISNNEIDASRWRYVEGVNIRIMRDPVIEGKYYIGGRDPHHHWEVTGGRNSPDLCALDKMDYRLGGDVTPEYTLPTNQIVDLYEQVRMLPYFDIRQAPLMEMQYGDDGVLYFLQYLKTGNVLHEASDYTLPINDQTVTVHNVKGSTDQEGRKVKIYLDPQHYARRMEAQAIFAGEDLSRNAVALQHLCMMGTIAICNTHLSFKDNHFSSSPLTRSQVALGLHDGVGEAKRIFDRLSAKIDVKKIMGQGAIKNYYLQALIRSNGRKATIESDWQIREEYIN
jgi:hypothetical protein